ncbi:MAG: DUF2797 domain-containing protein, partial [Actinomycetota bacterium]
MAQDSPAASLEPGPLVVLGSEWGPQGCQLRIRRPGNTSELIEAVGLELNYRADPSDPRHCVGHHSSTRNEGRYVDCHNRPQAGEKTCVSCAVADAEFASDLHHAHTRPADEIHESVRHHLQQTNILYLAAFRDGSIKVGTSTRTRRQTRLLEQGAWRAVEVAEVGDGFAVRRLEDVVTNRLGLPQAVATTRKLRGMVNPRSDVEVEEVLAGRTAEVHALLAGPDGRAAADGAIPTSIAWSSPEADDPRWDRPHPYPLAIETG